MARIESMRYLTASLERAAELMRIRRANVEPVRLNKRASHAWAVIAMVAGFALLSGAAVRAADDSKSPIFGTLPDSEDNRFAYYLFTLEKNEISLKMSGEDFCVAMKYGEVVKYKTITFASQPKVVEDGKLAEGPLEWVICRVPKK